MTEKKGWGMRCGSDVSGGAFVICYGGEITTEHLAEQSESNHYQYDLNHFIPHHRVSTGPGSVCAGKSRLSWSYKFVHLHGRLA